MKRFPAKILLFGEYGLLFGAKALALPFSNFGGKLQVGNKIPPKDSKEYSSYIEIDRFVSFFEYHDLNDKMNFPLNLDAMKEDLKNGLCFESDIPIGYGVGSSGALCAAIFDQYSVYHQQFNEIGRNIDLLLSLKKDFAVMEQYFHGKSSGIDPLVSFVNHPITFHNEAVSLVEFSPPSDFEILLIDTKVKSPTGPLVENFLKKMDDEEYRLSFKNGYLNANDEAVESFLNSNTSRLFKNLGVLTNLQLTYFKEMFPKGFAEQIREWQSDQILVKLLGSGGGGYLLAFVPKGKSIDPSNLTIKFQSI